MWVECSDCKRGIEVEVRRGTKRVKCQACGNVFDVTATSASESADRDDPIPASFEKPGNRVLLRPTLGDRSRETPFSEFGDGPPVPRAGFAKRPRDSRALAVGLDRATPTVLLAFVLAAGLNTLRGVMSVQSVPHELRTQLHLAWDSVVITALVDLGLFFGLVATAVWLGLFVASHIMKFVLAEPVYLKAAGIAALPTVLVALLSWPRLNPAVIPVLLLASGALTWLMLRMQFAMSALEALAAMGAALLPFLFAQAVAFAIGGQIAAGYCPHVRPIPAGEMFAWTDPVSRWRFPDTSPGNGDTSEPANGTVDPFSTYAALHSKPAAQANAPETPAVPTSIAPVYGDFGERLVAVEAPVLSDVSREQQKKKLSKLKAELESHRKAWQADYPGFTERLVRLDDDLADIPSEQPEPDLFRDPPAGTTWKPPTAADPAFGVEVSAGPVKLRPPLETSLDLDSGLETPKGMVYRFDQGRGAIVIRYSVRETPEQRVPWVLTRAFQRVAADEQRLFDIDLSGMSETGITAGDVGGIHWTRASCDKTASSERICHYVALIGERWLDIAFTGPASEEGIRPSVLFNLAAKSARLALKEPTADPFAAEALMRMLGGPNTNAVMSRLRTLGPSAEDALAYAVTHPWPQAPVTILAATFADCATARSEELLRQLSSSPDSSVAAQAQRGLIRLRLPLGPTVAGTAPPVASTPASKDPVANAILALDSLTPQNGRFGPRIPLTPSMQAIARMAPDGRRAAIAALLESALTNGNCWNEEDAVAEALVRWSGPNTVAAMLPLLRTDGVVVARPGGGFANVSQQQRHAAMKVLAAMKEQRSVLPIMEWLRDDPDAAVNALVAIAGSTEQQLIAMRAYTHQSEIVRTSTARILQKIGTSKCIPALEHASKDPRDYAAAAVAQVALDAVKARLAQPATRPATRPAQAKP